MFFAQEILEGTDKYRNKLLKRDSIHLQPRTLKTSKEKEQNSVFGEFASEIQIKSLDTIVKDYASNPFFKIKVDLLLKELEKDDCSNLGVG